MVLGAGPPAGTLSGTVGASVYRHRDPAVVRHMLVPVRVPPAVACPPRGILGAFFEVHPGPAVVSVLVTLPFRFLCVPL